MLRIDNILRISILVGRLFQKDRGRSRFFGLNIALLTWIMMLAVLLLAKLTNPVFWQFLVRNLILLTGVLFLLFKVVIKINHTAELKEGQHQAEYPG